MTNKQPPPLPVVAKRSKSFDPKDFGRYTLLKRLAVGGMAEVYLARQSGVMGFEKFVVIKKILSHLAEDNTFVNMFIDEARLAARLNHHNIVQIYDLGRIDDSLYIAMEYIIGESLGTLRKESYKVKQIMPAPIAAKIISGVCESLHYAHTLTGKDGGHLGIVHRDVTPPNILVTYEGGVKLVDFGIAKATTMSQKTNTGTLKGKWGYFSPEQCTGGKIDHRSDIFSLGVVLYELVTNKRCFKIGGEFTILKRIVEDDPVAPRAINPKINSDLEFIIEKSLQKDPDDRYTTAQEMQRDLERYLNTIPSSPGSFEISTYMKSLFPKRFKYKQNIEQVLVKQGVDTHNLSKLLDNIESEKESSSSIPYAEEASESFIEKNESTNLSTVHITNIKNNQGKSFFESLIGNRAASIITAFGILGIIILVSYLNSPNNNQDFLTNKNNENFRNRNQINNRNLENNSLKEIDPDPQLSDIAIENVINEENKEWFMDENSIIIDDTNTSKNNNKSNEPLGVKYTKYGETKGNLKAIINPKKRNNKLKIVSIKQKAYLDLVSEPSGGIVLINNKRIEKRTPIRKLELKPGIQHKIVIKKDGYKQWQGILKLSAGELNPLSVNLEPLPLSYGFLTINTKPWSEIYLGSNKLGITPISKIRLPAGKHILKAVNKDLGIDEKLEVRIIGNETTIKKVKLQKPFANSIPNENP